MVMISDVTEAFNLLAADTGIHETWVRLDAFFERGDLAARTTLMRDATDYYGMGLGAHEFLSDHMMLWDSGDECPTCAAVVALHGLTPPGTEVREFLTDVPVKLLNPKFRLAYPGNDPENGHAHLQCMNGHAPCDRCGNVIHTSEMTYSNECVCGDCEHEREKEVIAEAFAVEMTRTVGMKMEAGDVKVEMVKTYIEIGDAETGPMIEEGAAWQVTCGDLVYRECTDYDDQFPPLTFRCGDIYVKLADLGPWH